MDHEQIHRKHPPRSRFWKYFTPTKVKFFAQCNECKNVFSHKSTTGNLRAHLKKAHPKIFEAMKSHSEDEQMSHGEADGENAENTSQNNDTRMSDDQDESQNVANMSGIWKIFKKDVLEINGEDRKVQCSLCEEMVDYTSVSALRTHLDDRHSGYIKVMELCDKPRKNRSSLWKHFTPTDVKYFAECNRCKKIFSYKTTTGNLSMHLKKFHPGTYCSARTSENHVKFRTKVMDSIWRIFNKDSIEIIDNDRDRVQCGICQEMVVYATVSDLRTHLVNRHPENDDAQEFRYKKGDPRYKSRLWKYFTPTDRKFLAKCKQCKKIYSLKSMGNLKRHLEAVHPETFNLTSKSGDESTDSSESEEENTQDTYTPWENNGM